MNYQKGQGYKDGWNDRIEGKPNMSPSLRGCATTDDRVYWEEYVYGYADASRQVISDARKEIEEMKRFIQD
jgi:hypothetical protein